MSEHDKVTFARERSPLVIVDEPAHARAATIGALRRIGLEAIPLLPGGERPPTVHPGVLVDTARDAAAIAERVALQLEAFASPAPVVPVGVLEAPVPRDRVLVTIEGSRIVAVRPDPRCRRCLGSAAYVVTDGKKRGPCRCVSAQIDAMRAGASTTPPVAVGASPAWQPEADRNGARAARLAAVEAQIAEKARARDQALAAVDERAADTRRAAERAADDAAVLEWAIAADRVEAAASRKVAEELRRRLEVEERAARDLEERARRAEAERLPRMQSWVRTVREWVADVAAERERVAAHHARKLAPLERHAARLRARAGGR